MSSSYVTYPMTYLQSVDDDTRLYISHRIKLALERTRRNPGKQGSAVAGEIFLALKIPFPEEWSGPREILHVWHRPRPMWFMTHRAFCKRAADIFYTKPHDQVVMRLKSMKPVSWKWEDTEPRREVMRAVENFFAPERLSGGHELIFPPPRYYGVYDSWLSERFAEIRRLHDLHCRDCPWDWADMEMKFGA